MTEQPTVMPQKQKKKEEYLRICIGAWNIELSSHEFNCLELSNLAVGLLESLKEKFHPEQTQPKPNNLCS